MPSHFRRPSGRKTGNCQLEPLEPRRLLDGTILRPDHVVVVVLQDRSHDAIGHPLMPFVTQLASDGLVYTNSHSVSHPSQPNLHALYAGSTQGIGSNAQGYNFPTQPNLARSLFNAGFSFAGYSENLPADGSQVNWSGNATYSDLYVRYLNPMAQYGDLGIDPSTQQPRPNAAVNKTFAAFSAIPVNEYSSLPTVSYVIPNNLHSTHGSNEAYPWAGSPDEQNNNLLRQMADDWLEENLSAYLAWAKTNNSLLIVTADEERYTGGFSDTVTTIVNGDPDLFVAGVNSQYVNHYSLLRTITDMYGVAPLGMSAATSAFDINAQGQLIPASEPSVATTILLQVSDDLVTFGDDVTLTATLTAADSSIPTGSVLFMDGSLQVGVAPINPQGVAELVSDDLLSGDRTIRAYYLGAAGYAPDQSASVLIHVAGDSFANAASLSGNSDTSVADNTNATKEPGEPNHAGNPGGKSLWWTWTAPLGRQVTVDTHGSEFNTTLAVYVGSSLGSLTPVRSNNNDPARQDGTSKVSFITAPGVRYYIAVDGHNGASGDVNLRLVTQPLPPSTPRNLQASDGTHTGMVRLTWDPSANADYYELYRGTSSSRLDAVWLADHPNTTYDDASAQPGVVYWYWLEAVNAGGESNRSRSDSGYRAAVPSPAARRQITPIFSDQPFIGGTFGRTFERRRLDEAPEQPMTDPAEQYVPQRR